MKVESIGDLGQELMELGGVELGEETAHSPERIARFVLARCAFVATALPRMARPSCSQLASSSARTLRGRTRRTLAGSKALDLSGGTDDGQPAHLESRQKHNRNSPSREVRSSDRARGHRS
jgi:hypothetical protein